MFSFPLLGGNAATAAMGQTLRRDWQNQWKNFTVTAVFDDMQANSSLQFEFLINWQPSMKNIPGCKDGTTQAR